MESNNNQMQPNENPSSQSEQTKTDSRHNSPQTVKNDLAKFQFSRHNSKEDNMFGASQFQRQNTYQDDAASIASDVTFRSRPMSVQNQQLPYQNFSPYSTPVAYHGTGVISASVTPKNNFKRPISRQYSSDDLNSRNGSFYGQNRVNFKNPKKERNNMVLQVVLPSPSLQRTHSENNLFSYHPEGGIEATRGRPISESDSNLRLRHQQSFNEFHPQNEGISMINDMYFPSNRSNYDYDPKKSPKYLANSDTSIPKPNEKLPSTPEEKKNMFSSSLSMTLGLAYGLLVICLGVSSYIIDMLDVEEKSVHMLAEGFSLFLLLTALLYLLYLILDISIYIRKRHKYEKLLEQNTPHSIEMKENYNGTYELNITLPQIVSLKNQLDHRYCFNKDRHSSNFYLKLGAAGFCFGHLVHSLLILIYRGMSIGSTSEECFNGVTFTIEILYPLYSVVLLFFIFKYSNIIINKNTSLHRLGFMHCISSSLCFWVWTIFRETAEYLAYQKNKSEEAKTSLIPQISPRRFTKMCEHDELSYIYQNMSPYLYPFSVEFSILAVGILVIVWQNIGMCKSNPDHNLDDREGHAEHHEDTRECAYKRKQSVPESNVAIHADCHAANKGLFFGFIVLVFAIVATIVFFISYYNDLGDSGYLTNRLTHVVIYALMIVAVIAAYVQIVKLDVNSEAHNALDNFLLLICLPAFFVNAIFSIIPGIIFGRVLPVTQLVLEIVQVLIQTPFMIDGMSRSSNSKDLRKKKPGRQWVTFLVVTNVAMWIMETFEVKSHGLEQYRQDYYSKELWSIVGHICLPLIMFYRFHSSACLGDIWKYAYIRSGH